jgi:transcriptional regulator with XRE-family HTH domain
MKLTNEQVSEIRAYATTKRYTQKELSTMFNVSLSTINNIVNNRVYRNVSKVEDDVQFVCRKGCDEVFINARQRKTHENIHIKPFKCNECNIGYTTKSKANRCKLEHRATRHIKPDLFTLFDIVPEETATKKGDSRAMMAYYKDKYKRACLKHHPDKNGDAELFKIIQNTKDDVKDTLVNEMKINEYMLLWKENTRYKNYIQKVDVYNSIEQKALRDELLNAKRKMNELLKFNGTSNDEFKNMRKTVYKLKTQIKKKPFMYSRDLWDTMAVDKADGVFRGYDV